MRMLISLTATLAVLVGMGPAAAQETKASGDKSKKGHTSPLKIDIPLTGFDAKTRFDSHMLEEVVCDGVSVTRIRLECEQREKGGMLRFRARTFTLAPEDRQALLILGLRNDTTKLEIGHCYDVTRDASTPDKMTVDPSVTKQIGSQVEELLADTAKQDRTRVVVQIDAKGRTAGAGDLKCRVDQAKLMNLLKGKQPRLEVTLLVVEETPEDTGTPETAAPEATAPKTAAPKTTAP